MTKEWYVSMLVPDKNGKVKAETTFIQLGDKSNKQDVKEQIKRTHDFGVEILSITETGKNKEAYSQAELHKMKDSKAHKKKVYA